MYYMLLHAEPDPSGSDHEGCVGRIYFWAKADTADAAEALARHEMQDSGWLITKIEMAGEVTRGTYELATMDDDDVTDEERNQWLECFDEAMALGFTYESHIYPSGPGSE